MESNEAPKAAQASQVPQARNPEPPKFQATVREVPAENKDQARKSSDKIAKGTVRDFFSHTFGRKQSQATVSDPAPAAADVSENPQVFRLVPVSDSSYPVIYLSEGDIVTIGNRRYKFEK